MAVGFPTKTTYVNGDVFSASDINDTNGTVNLLNPTAKGSIISASAANTPSRLAVGNNGEMLIADSTATTGLKWSVPTLNHIKTVSYATGSASQNITLCFNSTYLNYRIACNMRGATASAPTLSLRMLSGTTTAETGSVYYGALTQANANASTLVIGSNAITSWSLGTLQQSSGSYNNFALDVFAPFDNGKQTGFALNGFFYEGGGSLVARSGGAVINSTTSYTGIQLNISSGNLEAGEIRVYGYNNG
jgi:hypothetical protein